MDGWTAISSLHHFWEWYHYLPGNQLLTSFYVSSSHVNQTLKHCVSFPWTSIPFRPPCSLLPPSFFLFSCAYPNLSSTAHSACMRIPSSAVHHLHSFLDSFPGPDNEPHSIVSPLTLESWGLSQGKWEKRGRTRQADFAQVFSFWGLRNYEDSLWEGV